MDNEIIDILTVGIADQATELSEDEIRRIRRERYDALPKTPTTMTPTNPVFRYGSNSYKE